MAEFSAEQARRFYDALGARQDRHAFYEEAPMRVLRLKGDWHRAAHVFELGCGTGRIAAQMLTYRLPPVCRYTAADISPVMVKLTTDRAKELPLPRLDRRFRVEELNGSRSLPFRDATFDRYLSTYVFDLFEPPQIRTALTEAHRVLRRGGLLCLAGLSYGRWPLSRIVGGVFSTLRAIHPPLVGGCRPVEMRPFLDPHLWRVETHETVTRYAIPSQAVVARRL